MKEKVVAIIPARGGSKGLPRKNILPLAGKPLIAYSIEPALKANLIDQVFGLIFWPFSATANAIVNGSFTLVQALAPAIILLYATVLFILAATLFSRKDLYLTE